MEWLRQNFGWSNSWDAWQERLVGLAFAIAASGLLALSLTWLALWQSAILWGLFGVALAICSRQGWIKLLGPVLFYDMVRTARQSRYAMMRFLYAAGLLSILLFMYLMLYLNFRDQRFHRRELAMLAQTFFGVFMLVQLAIVLLLTPAYVAGSISDEKEKKTLEFLLATDLRSREIVLSKLLSRIGNMTLLLLTGVPIVSMLQFAGGVDPQLLVAGFTAIAITLVSVACLSILLSTLFKKPRDAISLTYLLMIAYVATATVGLVFTTAPFPIMTVALWPTENAPTLREAFSMATLLLLVACPPCIVLAIVLRKQRIWIVPAILMIVAFLGACIASAALFGAEMIWPNLAEPLWASDNHLTLRRIIEVGNSGNPIAVIADVVMAVNGWTRSRARTTLAAELPNILSRYAWFHLIIAPLCVAWSIARLRPIALKQTVGGTTATLRWWQRLRPPIGDFPMFWKEVYIDGRMKLNWLNWLAIVVLVLLTVGSGVWVFGYALWEHVTRQHRDWFQGGGIAMNVWFRVAGTVVSCLLLLSLGVRAATCITQERERDTFDALITTPLSAGNMLFAKLLGNLSSMRLSWFWYSGMLALAVVTGGVHPIAVPLLVGALVVYAISITMIGLFYSMLLKSSLQATSATVLTALILGGGHWLITTCFCMPIIGVIAFAGGHGGGPGRFLEKVGEYFLKFQAGVTPPFVLAFSPFSWAEVQSELPRERHYWELIAFSIVGGLLWLLASGVLWFGVLLPMFRRLTRREELID